MIINRVYVYAVSCSGDAISVSYKLRQLKCDVDIKCLRYQTVSLHMFQCQGRSDHKYFRTDSLNDTRFSHINWTHFFIFSLIFFKYVCSIKTCSCLSIKRLYIEQSVNGCIPEYDFCGSY